MTGWTLLIALAATAGPGIKLGAPLPDNLPNILFLDHQGRVATHATCLRNQWVDPFDAMARLMASTELAATVQAKDGHLTSIDDLGPARYECVLLTPPEGAPR